MTVRSARWVEERKSTSTSGSDRRKRQPDKARARTRGVRACANLPGRRPANDCRPSTNVTQHMTRLSTTKRTQVGAPRSHASELANHGCALLYTRALQQAMRPNAGNSSKGLSFRGRGDDTANRSYVLGYVGFSHMSDSIHQRKLRVPVYDLASRSGCVKSNPSAGPPVSKSAEYIRNTYVQ